MSLFGFRVPRLFFPVEYVPGPELADCGRCGYSTFDILPGGSTSFGAIPDYAICCTCGDVIWGHFPEQEAS